MVEQFEIYFEDLKESVQKDLLRMFNISDPKQNNWDVMPISQIPLYEE